MKIMFSPLISILPAMCHISLTFFIYFINIYASDVVQLHIINYWSTNIHVWCVRTLKSQPVYSKFALLASPKLLLARDTRAHSISSTAIYHWATKQRNKKSNVLPPFNNKGMSADLNINSLSSCRTHSPCTPTTNWCFRAPSPRTARVWRSATVGAAPSMRWCCRMSVLPNSERVSPTDCIRE